MPAVAKRVPSGEKERKTTGLAGFVFHRQLQEELLLLLEEEFGPEDPISKVGGSRRIKSKPFKI